MIPAGIPLTHPRPLSALIERGDFEYPRKPLKHSYCLLKPGWRSVRCGRGCIEAPRRGACRRHPEACCQRLRGLRPASIADAAAG